MSTYNKQRVKELAEEQFQKDLDQSKEYINCDGLKFSDEEFNRFFMLFQASKYTNSTDMFKEWKFFISDDVFDEIICSEDDLLYAYNEIYDMEEALEDAKERKIIYGFMELGDDLWIINVGGE